ncbi:pectinesterase inhibitor 10-like [Fukomys damarensis]|uniref:pectinesterase inhibitor 10-like n=1 Tax=Fukomys damarensis TaxID=885580 RepID=UPI00054033F9|nr:pectinesterase inhibitor 10-like [Fukomys damarensis]
MPREGDLGPLHPGDVTRRGHRSQVFPCPRQSSGLSPSGSSRPLSTFPLRLLGRGQVSYSEAEWKTPWGAEAALATLAEATSESLLLSTSCSPGPRPPSPAWAQVPSGCWSSRVGPSAALLPLTVTPPHRGLAGTRLSPQFLPASSGSVSPAPPPGEAPVFAAHTEGLAREPVRCSAHLHSPHFPPPSLGPLPFFKSSQSEE